MTPIYAFDTTRRTNAAAIADAATLGFLDGEVLDLTIGFEAAFWKMYRPEAFITNDLNGDVDADLHLDATRTGLPDRWCDVAVFDPPYGHRGTSRLAKDKRYGITEYKPSKVVNRLIYDGTIEACRIARKHVLVKCQDACASATFRHQTAIVARAAGDAGVRVASQLHVFGAQAQPADKRQLNVWANYSTLMILKVGRRRETA